MVLQSLLKGVSLLRGVAAIAKSGRPARGWRCVKATAAPDSELRTKAGSALQPAALRGYALPASSGTDASRDPVPAKVSQG
ncbi:hypothetical protein PG993_011492 [Apiospora rasikravindrae]|uniref:Uncharacterized protein n=1 Tax=Apiospora rasikravindrae TaxID=990691 RepID=A0ABR1SEC9_9PEZI